MVSPSRVADAGKEHPCGAVSAGAGEKTFAYKLLDLLLSGLMHSRIFIPG